MRLAGAAVALKKIATGASSGSVSTGALSQVRSVRSSEAETARHPSGVTAMAQTMLLWPSSRRNVSPLSKSQSRSVRSHEGDTARSPSDVTTTDQTMLVWPSSVRIVWPLSKSQSRSVRTIEGRRGVAPIGRYRYGIDGTRMAFERAQCFAGS